VIEQQTLHRRALAELTGNVLPFWSSTALDPHHGGIHGLVSNDLRVDDTVERTAVLCARVLWSFSAAAHALDEPEYLKTAQLAHDYLLAHFLDPVHGGVFWSVDADGQVVNDRKQTYAQAFAVYALAEYARATGTDEPLRLAASLVDLVEEHCSDFVHGGYVEARARDWSPIGDVRLSLKDLNAPKSMNTLLHVMEGWTTFVRVTGDPAARERLAALTTTMLDHVLDEKTGAFRLFLDMAWRPLSDAVSFGHDIEGAWLLVAAARAVGDPDLLARAESAAVLLAEAVLRNGRDAEGAVLYEYQPAGPSGPAHIDRDSHWWAQAEGAVGFLEAHRITGDLRFLQATQSCWDVIEAHHVDRVHGDWFKVLDAQRRPKPDSPKVGPWECPYHHARACLEIIDRLPITDTNQEMQS
jgi:mannobiose 2-epimerase